MEQNEQIRGTVRRMQKIIYNILCDIDDFCKENNIMYFLSGGSCLGAVRHHGFIPWDDDADLMMPRNDYDRFLALFPQKFSGKYGVGALKLNSEWITQYARIWDLTSRINNNIFVDYEVGISVDVFPIDGLPERRLSRKIYYKKMDILRGLSNAGIRKAFLSVEKHRLLKKTAKIIVKPFGARYFTERMDQLARKYPFQSSKYVGASLAAHYGEKETIAREQMSSPIYMRFVDRDFPVPVGYNEYLTNLYGNYMEIPNDAEEKGYSHLDHWIVEFDVNETALGE